RRQRDSYVGAAEVQAAAGEREEVRRAVGVEMAAGAGARRRREREVSRRAACAVAHGAGRRGRRGRRRGGRRGGGRGRRGGGRRGGGGGGGGGGRGGGGGGGRGGRRGGRGGGGGGRGGGGRRRRRRGRRGRRRRCRSSSCSRRRGRRGGRGGSGGCRGSAAASTRACVAAARLCPDARGSTVSCGRGACLRRVLDAACSRPAGLRKAARYEARFPARGPGCAGLDRRGALPGEVVRLDCVRHARDVLSVARGVRATTLRGDLRTLGGQDRRVAGREAILPCGEKKTQGRKGANDEPHW